MCKTCSFGGALGQLGPVDPEVFAINRREEQLAQRNEEAARLDRVIELERVVATRSVARLADHLRAAERAHAAFEQEHGLDVDWPTWYASFLLGVR